MKKNTVFIVIIFIMFSCKQESSVAFKSLYDINIKYLDTHVTESSRNQSDTLWILFEGNYNNDTIDVRVNDKPFVRRTFTSEESIGVAGTIGTLPFGDINNIDVRINSGNLIHIEPKKVLNLSVIYIDSLVTVKFYDKFPGFE